MNKIIETWVREEYPQKADYIIKHALSENILREMGVELADHEIFVKLPKPWGAFYGSNYGRLISHKFGRWKVRKENLSPDGHIYYVLTNGKKKRKGKRVGKTQRLTISGQRLVGWLFLPCFWEDLTTRQIEVHHLDKDHPDINKWTGLLQVPVWLHKWAEYADVFWLNTGEKFERKNPYEIMD